MDKPKAGKGILATLICPGRRGSLLPAIEELASSQEDMVTVQRAELKPLFRSSSGSELHRSYEDLVVHLDRTEP